MSSLPVTAIARQLETCSASQFQLILGLLRSTDYINEKLLKTELALLITKTLALLRSSEDEKVWRGCHVAVVICAYNPLVLCCYSGQLLGAIYSKLEQKVDYYSTTITSSHGKVLFEALVFAISCLIELMKDKPTLSRESLTPKLKTIIPTLINLAQHQPNMCLPVLKKLIYKNTTTFKPFASKYRQLIMKKISSDYEQFDEETRGVLIENLAYLHLIKANLAHQQDEASAHHKVYQDENWRIGILSILSQFRPVIELCGEFLDFDQDKDLKTLVKNLNLDHLLNKEATDLSLSILKLDLNKPLTLWELPKRLNLLIDLLSPFISSPTPYAVRIPFGSCINICEALLSITRNYLPFKRDVRRDSQLTSVIDNVITQVQYCGVRLLYKVSRIYGENCLSMLPSILSSLELFIPLQSKSTNIDFERCSLLKKEFFQVFETVNTLFSYMGHQFQETDLFTKLVDVALHLSGDLPLTNFLFKKESYDANNKHNSASKKQKKDNSAGALSDLYTHPDKFTVTNSQQWHNVICSFLRCVISSWRLPSNQQIKIIKYSISYSLKFKEEFGFIPAPFVQLLRTEVINPGNERISILPIAVSLLKGSKDDVFDVLCHPRLPMSIVHPITKMEKHVDQVSEGYSAPQRDHHIKNAMDVQSSTEEVVENSPGGDDPKVTDKPEKPIIEPSESRERDDSIIQTSQIDETLIYKKRSTDQTDALIEVTKRQKVKETRMSDEGELNEIACGQLEEEKVEEEEREKKEEEADNQVPITEISDEDDSEFEIPAIQVSDDDEDEE